MASLDAGEIREGHVDELVRLAPEDQPELLAVAKTSTQKELRAKVNERLESRRAASENTNAPAPMPAAVVTPIVATATPPSSPKPPSALADLLAVSTAFGAAANKFHVGALPANERLDRRSLCRRSGRKSTDFLVPLKLLKPSLQNCPDGGVC